MKVTKARSEKSDQTVPKLSNKIDLYFQKMRRIRLPYFIQTVMSLISLWLVKVPITQAGSSIKAQIRVWKVHKAKAIILNNWSTLSLAQIYKYSQSYKIDNQWASYRDNL